MVVPPAVGRNASAQYPRRLSVDDTLDPRLILTSQLAKRSTCVLREAKDGEKDWRANGASCAVNHEATDHRLGQAPTYARREG